MSPAFATFILMNNYFHDVATAMLLACGIVMWAITEAERRVSGGGAAAYAASMLRSVARLAWFSAAWIAVSGVVRLATAEGFEWKNFADKGLEAGLVAKYVIAVFMIAVGVFVLYKRTRNKNTNSIQKGPHVRRTRS